MLTAGPSSSIARCSSKPASLPSVPEVGDGSRGWPSAATVDSACAADPAMFIGSTDTAAIIAPAKAKTRTCLRAELSLPAIMPHSTPLLRIIGSYQPGRPVSFGVLEGDPILRRPACVRG